MRVLLYDQDQQRNKKLQRYLENKDIQVKAVYSLKDFLSKIEKPSLKIVIVEQTLVQHYNLDIEDILSRLGFDLIVIVYTETEERFDFSIHYADEYLYFPFMTKADKQLLKSIKKCLKKRRKKKKKAHKEKIKDTNKVQQASTQRSESIQKVMHRFSPIEEILITQLIKKKEGITIQDIITLLNAETAKNTQNYAQVQMYRLRNKLTKLLGTEYIISCNNHTYQLIYMPQA